MKIYIETNNPDERKTEKSQIFSTDEMNMSG